LPELFVSSFTHEKDVIAVGVTYLHVVSWSFVASAVIFSCSSAFQGIGNTWPALASSGLRLLTFVLPVYWLSTQPDRQLKDIWYVSVASLALQALSSVVLLQAQFRKKLAPMVSEPPPATEGLPTAN
jgi:Na+-driven multidrug efflux pump